MHVMWCDACFKCELPVPVLFFWDKVTDGDHKSKISSFFYACWTWKAWSLDNWNEKLKSSLFWFQWWGKKMLRFGLCKSGGRGWDGFTSLLILSWIIAVEAWMWLWTETKVKCVTKQEYSSLLPLISLHVRKVLRTFLNTPVEITLVEGLVNW